MKNIIVRAPNWLGDAVMCLPFLRRLRAIKPNERLTVLCPAGLQDLFQGAPFIDETMTFGPGEKGWSLSRRLRRNRYDEGFILPPSFSSALVLALAGVRERVGYATDFRGFLLTRALPLDERYHYVRRYLGLIGEAGRNVGPEDFYYPRSASPAESAERILAEAGAEWKPPVLAVAPGSRAPARRWPSARFAEVIHGLAETDWPTVLVLGSAGDRAAADAVAGAARRPVINLCGKTNLAGLFDILRRSQVLVTNESGMMHVAWAVGTPSVVLAGPSEPRATSPFGARVRVIQHREVPCVPCVRNECYRPGREYMECMDRIHVDEVRRAIEQVTEARTSLAPGNR